MKKEPKIPHPFPLNILAPLNYDDYVQNKPSCDQPRGIPLEMVMAISRHYPSHARR